MSDTNARKRPSPHFTRLVSAFGVACESYGEQGAAGRPPARVTARANDAEAELFTAIANLEEQARAAADARWSAWLRMWADVGAAHEHAIAMLYLGADYIEEHRRSICAHCDEPHDLASGAMAAHVRACAKNPMVAAMEADRARLARLSATARNFLDFVEAMATPEPIAAVAIGEWRREFERDVEPLAATPRDERGALARVLATPEAQALSLDREADRATLLELVAAAERDGDGIDDSDAGFLNRMRDARAQLAAAGVTIDAAAILAEDAETLTVGAALDGGCAVEFQREHGTWWQIRDRSWMRAWRGSRWGEWTSPIAAFMDETDRARRCRLVPLAEADADPSTRGAL